VGGEIYIFMSARRNAICAAIKMAASLKRPDDREELSGRV